MNIRCLVFEMYEIFVHNNTLITQIKKDTLITQAN